MKANGAKRKIFNDAIDLLDQMEEAAAVPENAVRMLSAESIRPFRGHPFRMYEGERLEDMVQSIREHGVLNPVIVRKQEDGYEMLSGHNRQRAAMLAGIDKIPAIVKENLSDEDAIVYVIETNMIQRSFSELLPSEKAAVLAVRYEKISSQGKRNDILQEIAALNGQEGTCGHDVHKSRSRDELGNEYGMTGRNIARYMRVDKLIPEFKEELDNGALSLVAAVDLSYLSEKEQKAVAAAVSEDKVKLNPKNAAAIRAESGNITQKSIRKLRIRRPGIRKKRWSILSCRQQCTRSILRTGRRQWRQILWKRHWKRGSERRRRILFSKEELKSLDRKYFAVIAADEYDVTVMSRNTGHYWYIHNPEYPGKGSCVIFHKHKASHPYHQHGRADTLRQAVRSIQGHDKWVMNVKN